MEMSKREVKVVADVALAASEKTIVELVELELALIGGGCGEVVLA